MLDIDFHDRGCLHRDFVSVNDFSDRYATVLTRADLLLEKQEGRMTGRRPINSVVILRYTNRSIRELKIPRYVIRDTK
jgi:hypothetical protein